MTVDEDDESDGRTQEGLIKSVEAQMDLGNASKRAREVARIILDRGSCTTSDLEDLGYKHAPRAVRDLRDAGIDVVTTTESYTDNSTGGNKRRARYTVVGVIRGKVSRHPLSKDTVDAVKSGGHCEVCGALPPTPLF